MLELRRRRVSDGTLSSTEHGDGEVLLFDEREAVYTGGRSVNTTSAVGDCAVGSCWRWVAAGSRLRGYVGGVVDGMGRGASSFGGEEDVGGGEKDHEGGWGCGSVVPRIFWVAVGIGCAAAIVVI